MNTDSRDETRSGDIQTREPFSLPDDFLLGTATAGLQIEGGDTNNSWYDWAARGGVTDGSSPVTANDHWNRIESDTGLMTSLGVHTHRMGVEWSRIEPEPGCFDHSAIDHYRAELGHIRDAGVVPLVTLHHFTNPLWLEKKGGWIRPETVERFARYVRHVVTELRDLVADWVTINEPNVYLVQGYVLGEWPPGHTRTGEFLRGSRTMIHAHREAYRIIHAQCPEPVRVGVAHHIRLFQPAQTPGSRLVAGLWHRLFHDRFTRPMSRYSDFLGVNYYTRDVIRATPRARDLFGVRETTPGSPVSDLDWEIYPEGLHTVVRRLHQSCGLPIYITENGISDRNDVRRARFIYDHLRQVRRLLDDNVPVERYYHWTLMDNFEWSLGETAAFGLYECDFRTQERRLRASGRFYSDVCRARAVTAQAIVRHLDTSPANR